MLDINKCQLVPGVTFWGEIAGNIETQKDLVSKLSTYATESWVNNQGYLVQSDLSQYATRQWVTSRGYVTEDYVTTALSGYATESWVSSQGYLTSDALSGYATESYVTTALSGYATESWVISTISSYVPSLSGYATESWVISQGYAHLSDLSSVVEYDIEIPLADASNIGSVDVLNRPVDEETYETETLVLGYAQTGDTTWDVVEARGSQIGENSYEVEDGELIETGFQHYATESWVEGQGYLTSVPSEYATQSWVTSQSYALNADLLSLASRVSDIESTLGVAMSITNNILS